ncbi:hypothetical protein V2J09_004934 [Rumex salicifolius]
MVAKGTWLRYLAHKFVYSASLSYKNYTGGHISDAQVGDSIWRNLLQGKLTYLHRYKGQEMAPLVGSEGGTFLVRKIPNADSSRVFVGDVVVVKDPGNSENLIVRRLAASEGYEMVSTDEKEDPFILDEGECWVLSDNEALLPKEAKDSRTFGPVQMSNILGRAIYCLRNAVDHGPVQNSKLGMQRDLSVLEVELDVEDMAKNQNE